MTIETKYNRGDIVYIISDNKICKVKINSIKIQIFNNVDISYDFITDYNHSYEHRYYNENNVFKTIADLTNYLVNKHYEDDRNR